MPDVILSVGKANVSRAEVAPNFEVRDDKGALIGELTVSMGGVRWRPSHYQSAHFLDWEAFGALMENQPRE
jgi:hypothetical protein